MVAATDRLVAATAGGAVVVGVQGAAVAAGNFDASWKLLADIIAGKRLVVRIVRWHTLLAGRAVIGQAAVG